MIKKPMYFVAILAVLFSACKNDVKKEEANEAIVTEMNDKTEETSNDTSDAQDNSATSEIIDGYLALKNALVDTDSKKAADAGTTLLAAFSSFDMASLSTADHKEYMEIAENAIEQTEHIVESPMDHQREHFEILSNDISDLIALLGTDKTLYQDFCPMYNKNKGGMWISETKNIRNPYFGDKMMTCGKMQKQIN